MSKVYDKNIIKLIEDTEAGKIHWMYVIGGYQSTGTYWFLTSKNGNKSITYRDIPLDLSDYNLLTYLDIAIEKSLKKKEEEHKERILAELEPKKEWWKFW